MNFSAALVPQHAQNFFLRLEDVTNNNYWLSTKKIDSQTGKLIVLIGYLLAPSFIAVYFNYGR